MLRILYILLIPKFQFAKYLIVRKRRVFLTYADGSELQYADGKGVEYADIS